MAEEQSGLSDLTNDDFRSFLTEKNVNGICEVCGTGDWTYIVQTERNQTFGLPVVAFPDETVANVSMAGQICNNCSHTRLFWRFKIDEWKAAKNKVGAPDV